MVAAISSIDTVEVSKNGKFSALNNVSAMETSLRQLLSFEYSPSGLSLFEFCLIALGVLLGHKLCF